jgi:hypothetical protein
MADQNDEEKDHVDEMPTLPQGGNVKLWYERLNDKQKAAYERGRA